MDKDLAETVRWLADRAAITDVITAFAVGLDTRDWDLVRSCFTDPVEVDYPDSAGVMTTSLDDVLASSKGFFGRLDATQHISANHQIAIDGDSARCVSTLTAQHYLASAGDQPVQRQIGYYVNFLVRTDDGWRIRRTEQHQGWTEGNPDVMAHAAEAFG